MVKDLTRDGWECPYCENKFDEQYDAEECAEECAHIERTRKITIYEYVCDGCNNKFKDEFKAENCEIDHKNKHDKFYENMKRTESKRKLDEASKHPNQIQLINST